MDNEYKVNQNWDDMSARQRMHELDEKLSDMGFYGCDFSKMVKDYWTGELTLWLSCIPIGADTIDYANFEAWKTKQKQFGLDVNLDGNRIGLYEFETEYLTKDDADDLLETCYFRTQYPIIDDDIYSETEASIFDEQFADAFLVDGKLKPQYMRYGEESLRELAWEFFYENDYVDCDEITKRISA